MMPQDPEPEGLYSHLLSRYVVTTRLLRVADQHAVADAIRRAVSSLGAVNPLVDVLPLGEVTPRAGQLYTDSAEALTRELWEHLSPDTHQLVHGVMRAVYGAGFAAGTSEIRE